MGGDNPVIDSYSETTLAGRYVGLGAGRAKRVLNAEIPCYTGIMRHVSLLLLCFVFILAPKCLVVYAQEERPCALTNASGLVVSPNQESTDRRYAIAPGAWSSATVSLFNTWSSWDTNPGRVACFYSPDHIKKITIRDGEASITIGGRTFETGFFTLGSSELGWAQDSSRLFVTWSDGGELGRWQTYVYDVTPNGLILLHGVQKKARRDFERRIHRMPINPDLDTETERIFWKNSRYCTPYNVVGSQWLNGSKELLISVIVQNVGDCRYMSEFNVYRVEVPTGTILERFSAVGAHKKFDPATLPIISP